MNVKFDWHGLEVSAEIIEGDWIGDPSIPGGTQTIPPYVNDYSIEAPDGAQIQNFLSDRARSEIEALALEEAGK